MVLELSLDSSYNRIVETKSKPNLKNLTSLLIGTCATFISLVTSFSSGAVSLSSTSNIKVVNPISFTEEQKLAFGTISTSSFSNIVEIDPSGQIANATTAEHLDISEVSYAKIKISGSNNNSMAIKAEYVENEASIEVLSMKAIFNDSQGDLLSGLSNLNASSGGSHLIFGAGIRVSQEAVEGDYSPSFLISVNYE